METPKIFESEYRFCRILWDNEPIGSGALVQLCREQLGWKPTTTPSKVLEHAIPL